MENIELYIIGATLLLFIIIQMVIGFTNYWRNVELDDPQHNIPRKKVCVMRLDVWITFLMVFFFCSFGWEADVIALAVFVVVCWIQLSFIGHNN